MDNKTLTGTVQIYFDTDGDFGFRDAQNIISDYGWKFNYNEDAQSYTFTIDNFVGTSGDLREKIICGLFMNVCTSRPYIMRTLCGVFEKLERHVSKDEIEPDFYEDLGNQSVSATFALKPADRKQSLEQEIKCKTQYLNYYKDQVLSYQRQVSEIETNIDLLKKELEAL